MSFFDDVVANVKVIATNVGQKASKIKDYSKLKYSEAGIKSEIVKKKTKLGGYVYECSKTGDIDKVVMEQFVDEINELEENLQITQEMIAAAKNKVTCDVCKTENEKDSVYCRKCGQKLKETVVEETDDETCECNEGSETTTEETCDCKEKVEEVVETVEEVAETVAEDVEKATDEVVDEVVSEVVEKAEEVVEDIKEAVEDSTDATEE
ncbi:MAG: hypothetical protein IJU14_04950 [Clostridia bacterium]|nr:hypothetical protein [Clostridia bacterium]